MSMAGGAAATPEDETPTAVGSMTQAELFKAADQAGQQIRQLDERLEIAAEEYNGARVRLDEVSSDLVAARIALARREDELQQRQDLLASRLAWIYKRGDLTWLDALLNSSSFADAENQMDFFARLSRQDRAEEQAFKGLVATVDELERIVAASRDEALAIEQQMEDEKLLLDDKLAERQAVLDGLDARIEKILGDYSRLDQQAAAKLARAAHTNLASIRGTPAQIAVVSETLKYLGIDYVWAGATPEGGFDCSGLVLYVYAKFGVHVPHFAAYQANYGRRVAYGDLQPADLVFFGNPIHHVGIYAGRDLFIHAPHTGDVVKVSRLSTYEMPSACARYTGLITRLP
jgi:cell wall-associated NlpC family hydrolase